MKKSNGTDIKKMNVVSKQMSYDRLEPSESINVNKTTNNNSRIALPTVMQMPAKAQLPKRILLPMIKVAKPKPVRIPVILKPSVVNKLKYTNVNEFNKQRNQQNVENCDSKSDDDDDDCILVEEQNSVRS